MYTQRGKSSCKSSYMSRRDLETTSLAASRCAQWLLQFWLEDAIVEPTGCKPLATTSEEGACLRNAAGCLGCPTT